MTLKESVRKFRNDHTFWFWFIRSILVLLLAIYSFSILAWLGITVASFTTDLSLLGYSGLFGDSFNILSSLFAGVALILIVISVKLQNDELSQFSSTFKLDSFERTFFNMINLFNEQRDDLTVTSGPNSNRYAINVFMDYLKKKQLRDISETNIRAHDYVYQTRGKAENKVLDMMHQIPDDIQEPSLTHLLSNCDKAHFNADDPKRFVHLCVNVLNFICTEAEKMNQLRDGELDEGIFKEQKTKYSHIFWSQLTDTEIEFLMVYGYAFKNGDGFKIERYFKTCPPELETYNRICSNYPFLSNHYLPKPQ